VWRGHQRSGRDSPKKNARQGVVGDARTHLETPPPPPCFTSVGVSRLPDASARARREPGRSVNVSFAARMAPSSQPVVVVTGCSEGGIGWQLCVAFAAAGCRVFASARRLEAMRGLEAHGCTCLALDVTAEASIKAAVAEVLAQAGRVDVLVNNAGRGCAGPLAEVPLAQVEATFKANVFGLLAVTQAVVPSMAARRSGTVVNIASIVGHVATPFAGVYCSTKAAVVSMGDCMRVELAPFGVRVVTVCPGAVRSHFGDNTADALDLSSFKLYAPFSAAVAARAKASQSASSTPAEELAARVVRDVLRPKPPAMLWVGHMSTLFWILSWLPLRLRDALLTKRFGLSSVPPDA
jgi:NAD(P)-dependent dehydrogenase (short-subunit alcohol dehydrogenase family)